MRPSFAFCLSLLFAATGLRAQLDPRLQKDPTDFMDLYQSGTEGKIKPEIVSTLDFSGSMNQIMFHSAFPNKTDEEGPFDNYNIGIQIKFSGGVYSLDTAWNVLRNSYRGTQTTTLTVGTVTYTLSMVGLVKPNGDLVTSADAAAHVNDNQLVGSSGGAGDVRNWIRCASHARVKATFSGTSRTIDLPLPWTILDENTDGAYTKGTPLQNTQVKDPKTGTMVDLDLNHRGSTANNIYLQADAVGATVQRAYIGTREVQLYRQQYLAWIFSGKDGTGNYFVPDTTAQSKPFQNRLPNKTRLQALKVAIIRTWLKYQDQVFWSFRGLQVPSSSTLYDATTNTPASIALPPGNSTSGGDSNWKLFNSYPLDGARLVSKLVADSGTPLTRSLVHSYAQYQDQSPWDRVHKKTTLADGTVDDQTAVDCLKHFVLLFTDGVPNIPEDLLASNEDLQPYGQGAAAGNKAIVTAGLSSLNFKGTHWNVPTLAGVAAHGGDSRVGWIRDPKGQSQANKDTPANFAPFFVQSRRNADNTITTFSTAHPVQTMTVGVSLGGSFNADGSAVDPASDVRSPKYRLLAAAAYGDPIKTSQADMTVTGKSAFQADANGTAKPGSVYFFDAMDPDSLVENLDKAFYAISQLAKTGVASAPVVPFSGLALARQIYLGNFKVPEPANPLWSGDLMMFPTFTEGLKTQLLTSSGTVVPTLDPKTATDEAQWSAKKLMNAAGDGFWKNRVIWTRPKATASPSDAPALVKFSHQAGADFDAFKANLPAGTDLERQKMVAWMRGADTSTAEPYKSRVDLMGDVIGSAPAVLEYGLDSKLAEDLGAKDSKLTGARVRVVLVGTNSGFLHAFGEFSWEESVEVGDKTITVTKATAKELWSFLPTDFLPYITYGQNSANPHRAMVDGAPSVYHLDLPPAGKRAGNGKVDNGEKALVIFGLRKGGRSYYALNLSDPLNPAMAWALSADEAATLPDSRIKTGDAATVRALVKNMGFSTSLPAIGRVLFTEDTGRRVKSVTFLGGGHSVPAVEAEFKDATGQPTPLGRSVFALETFTGNILMSWDLKGKSGPVSAGVVPFEFFRGSGFVQRAYFTDRNGGLWALGSGERGKKAGDGTDYTVFRIDSNDLDKWTDTGAIGGTPTVRKIYQGPTNDLHSTLPGPFNLATFPVYRADAPKLAPATVGVTFVSGDRNNPVDKAYAVGKAPAKHRINVVFDRQDTSAVIDTSTMQDMSGQTDPAADLINLSKSEYFLKSKLGYYIDFPTPSKVGTLTYIPKGINEPMVLGGVLFYSYFRPTSGDSCNPGGGLTRSWRVCDVLRPVVNTSAGTSSTLCNPGFVMEWAGVASNFGSRGTVAVNQAGGVTTSGGDTGTGASDDGKIAIGTATGSYKGTFPKPRVWRSVHGEL